VKFEVTILGSGASLPTLQRNCSAQYITCQNKHILIDCAEGTQLQLRKFGIKFQRLSVILISHLHGDHYFGLVGLISSMRLMGRDKNLMVIGPRGLKKIILDQLEIGYTELDFDIDFIELTGKESNVVYEDKVIEIRTFPLKHKIPTNGFLIKEKEKERNLKPGAINHPEMKLEYIHRLKKGEDIQLPNGGWLKNINFTKSSNPSLSYAYCSDTAFSEKLIEDVKESTVLYHEATFLEQDSINAKNTMHSTATQAATIAQRANVGTLYMGHLSARYSDGSEHEIEARKIFKNAHYVQDGTVILVKQIRK